MKEERDGRMVDGGWRMDNRGHQYLLVSPGRQRKSPRPLFYCILFFMIIIMIVFLVAVLFLLLLVHHTTITALVIAEPTGDTQRTLLCFTFVPGHPA